MYDLDAIASQFSAAEIAAQIGASRQQAGAWLRGDRPVPVRYHAALTALTEEIGRPRQPPSIDLIPTGAGTHGMSPQPLRQPRPARRQQPQRHGPPSAFGAVAGVADCFNRLVTGTHPLQTETRTDPGYMFAARVADARQHGYPLMTALRLAIAAAAPPPPPGPPLWYGMTLPPARSATPPALPAPPPRAMIAWDAFGQPIAVAPPQPRGLIDRLFGRR